MMLKIKFANLFITILIEAVPFVILGSFVSAVIQLYVSQDIIKRIIPRNIVLAYFEMALIGMIMPLCECAIVPIARRLIKKGMPVGLGITFMLAVPIVNPIVILSTYYAFYNNISIVILRTIGGIVCSIMIGVIINLLCRSEKTIRFSGYEENEYCSCGCSMEKRNIISVIKHTNIEFLEITRYLICGAFLSSAFQIFCEKFNMIEMSNNKILAIIFMMMLGFSLSLCSEADAFVGAGFLETQGICGCLGFLLLGPMLDLKNLIILMGVFRKKFVLKLSVITMLCIFSICILFMFMGF